MSDTGGASPSAHEMATLTISEMPVQDASAGQLFNHGVQLPPANPVLKRRFMTFTRQIERPAFDRTFSMQLSTPSVDIPPVF